MENENLLGGLRLQASQVPAQRNVIRVQIPLRNGRPIDGVAECTSGSFNIARSANRKSPSVPSN
jgi:hypothetical protein